MKNCLYCGNQMPDNVMFCPMCGAPQPGGQMPQQPSSQYNNALYNNSQDPYSQQNPYPQQPYYGNPPCGAPQQPVNNFPPGYPPQQNGYGNGQYNQYYGNSQNNPSQMPNYGSYQQQNFDSGYNNQSSGKKTKQKDEKSKTSCLTIGLWILFFPVMLWIYAIKKKQPVWYVVAAAVSLICLGSVIVSPKKNPTSSVSEPGSIVQTSSINESNVHESKNDSNSLLISKEKQEESLQVGESNDTTKQTYTISNLTVVDNENITFKILEAKVDKIWGFTLKTYCENKMTDKTLMFSVDDVSVNGYMIDPLWATEVAAGKKANKDMSFSSSSMEKAGITNAEQIKFTLRVYNSDDWLADDVLKDTYTIYPTGLSEGNIHIPARKTTDKEKIIVDNELCTFIILDTRIDSIWGYTLDCYLENKTDNKKLMFSWDDVDVNGYMIDPFWSTSVAEKSRKYSDIKETLIISQLLTNNRG